MDTNTIIIYISTTSLSTIMIIIAMFTLFNNLSKRITKLEIEVKTGFQTENSNKETIKELKSELKEQRTEIKAIKDKLFDISKVAMH